MAVGLTMGAAVAYSKLVLSENEDSRTIPIWDYSTMSLHLMFSI